MAATQAWLRVISAGSMRASAGAGACKHAPCMHAHITHAHLSTPAAARFLPLSCLPAGSAPVWLTGAAGASTKSTSDWSLLFQNREKAEVRSMPATQDAWHGRGGEAWLGPQWISFFGHKMRGQALGPDQTPPVVESFKHCCNGCPTSFLRLGCCTTKGQASTHRTAARANTTQTEVCFTLGAQTITSVQESPPKIQLKLHIACGAGCLGSQKPTSQPVPQPPPNHRPHLHPRASALVQRVAVEVKLLLDALRDRLIDGGGGQRTQGILQLLVGGAGRLRWG